MKTFLGVPIVLRGVAYGNLYLTEKDGRRATSPTRTRSWRSCSRRRRPSRSRTRGCTSRSTRWLRQLESLNEIGNALVSELELEPLLALVARRLRELVEARLVLIALPDGDGAASRGGRGRERGRRRRDASSRSAARRPAACSSAAAASGSTPCSTTPRSTSRSPAGSVCSPALYVPLSSRGRAIGVVIAHDKDGPTPPSRDDDLRLAETLAARAAIAVDLSRAGEPRRRATRGRGPGARARAARARAARRDRPGADVDPARAEAARAGGELRRGTRRRSASVRELVVSTLQNVRRLAVELRPSALDDFGLVRGARAARATRSASRAASTRRSRDAVSATSGCRARSRRRSTASSRRR